MMIYTILDKHYEACVEFVAKTLLNADLDNFGQAYPWPTSDEPRAVQARQQARDVASVALMGLRDFIYQLKNKA